MQHSRVCNRKLLCQCALMQLSAWLCNDSIFKTGLNVGKSSPKQPLLCLVHAFLAVQNGRSGMPERPVLWHQAAFLALPFVPCRGAGVAVWSAETLLCAFLWMLFLVIIFYILCFGKPRHGMAGGACSCVYSFLQKAKTLCASALSR